MPIASIYVRLSEEDRDKASKDDDSRSIQNQKTMLIQFATSRGWEIYDIYNDDDYAGADRKRPEFNRLLKDAEARKFDIVLCKSQSRFTREMELVEKYLHYLFPIWGIRFVSIVDNADTDNKGNKKSRQINGLVNEWYLEDMSDNIKSVLTSRRENGFHIGAFAPYGYKKDPNLKGHLIIDEPAAQIVKEIFTLFAQGYGKTNIARILNDRNIPNSAAYKLQCGIRYTSSHGKNSGQWKYSAIATILVNEVYIGHLVQGRYESVSYKTKECRPRPKEEWIRVENTHEPIIDMELWNRVQQLIVERAKPWGDTGHIGIFARKVLCEHCGYTMRSHKNRGRRYLTCSNRFYAKDSCVGSFISLDTLEKMILNELRSMSEKYLDMDELEDRLEFQTDLQAQMRRVENEMAAYEKKRAEFLKGLKDLYMDKARGFLCEADFQELSSELSADRERLDKSISECKTKLATLEERKQLGESRRAIIERYVNMEHLTRQAVEVLIDKIYVSKRINGERYPRITIHWNF